MRLEKIFEFLNKRFPCDTACDFDNVGILVGHKNADIKKAMIALDCTDRVITEATENNCQLIITHHPVIFEPIKSITDESIIFKLLTNNLSVISMHTNLDMGDGGVNDTLCKIIGLKDIKPYIASDGYVLKYGTIPPTPADIFATELKKCLGGRIKYVAANKPISKVLVCSGSGGGFITDAIAGDFDALVTADVKHNQFIEAVNMNFSLFDAGHFETENIIVKELYKLLSKGIEDVEFISSDMTYLKYS